MAVVVIIAALIVAGLWLSLQWARRSPAGLVDTQATCLALLGRLSAGGFDPEQRAQADKFTGMMLASGKGSPNVSKSQILVASREGDIPCTVYSPQGIGPFPVLVWIHGGCWVMGQADHGEKELRYIADRANTVVLSVDYRLAPEHPFPAGFNDCYHVTSWLVEYADEINAKADSISIGGSSAGGNLAAAVALRARDKNSVCLRFQYLQVPITDAMETDQWPSYQQSGDKYLLTVSSMKQAIDMYVPAVSLRSNCYVSPYRTKDLSRLPRTLITTAQIDPLRDQGEAYAERLSEQGVSVEHYRLQGTIHGFIGSPKAMRTSSELAVQALLEVNQSADSH